MKSIVIVGTGLIGASVGLALKAGGFAGTVLGFDTNAAESDEALQTGAIDEILTSRSWTGCSGSRRCWEKVSS
jgi:prephenate dehydrogenase